MLDRKTKDLDASVELLEDRKNSWKWIFLLFYLVGIILLVWGGTFSPYKYDEIAMCMGIGLMIIATWFFIGALYFNILIYLKRQFEKVKT